PPPSKRLTHKPVEQLARESALRVFDDGSGHVTFSRVGEHHHDDLTAEFVALGYAQRRRYRRARRDTGEDPLFARQSARVLDGGALGNRHDFVDQLAVENLRDKAGADALDEMWTWRFS